MLNAIVNYRLAYRLYVYRCTFDMFVVPIFPFSDADFKHNILAN